MVSVLLVLIVLTFLFGTGGFVVLEGRHQNQSVAIAGSLLIIVVVLFAYREATDGAPPTGLNTQDSSRQQNPGWFSRS